TVVRLSTICTATLLCSFFYLSSDPPFFYLHSFPTRRSSDLGVAVRVAKLPMGAVLRTRTTGETRGFMKALLDAQTDRILGFTMLDRKSTRLNSSHGSISYAVFCLKKKKLIE